MHFAEFVISIEKPHLWMAPSADYGQMCIYGVCDLYRICVNGCISALWQGVHLVVAEAKLDFV